MQRQPSQRRRSRSGASTNSFDSLLFSLPAALLLLCYVGLLIRVQWKQQEAEKLIRAAEKGGQEVADAASEAAAAVDEVVDEVAAAVEQAAAAGAAGGADAQEAVGEDAAGAEQWQQQPAASTLAAGLDLDHRVHAFYYLW